MATRLPTKRGHGGDANKGMTAMEPEQGKAVGKTAREKAILVAYYASINGKPEHCSREWCKEVFANHFRVTVWTHKDVSQSRIATGLVVNMPKPKQLVLFDLDPAPWELDDLADKEAAAAKEHEHEDNGPLLGNQNFHPDQSSGTRFVEELRRKFGHRQGPSRTRKRRHLR